MNHYSFEEISKNNESEGVNMGDYNIRFAGMNDIPTIMNFIDEHWKKNHILARDRKLFEWQYINNNKLNMVVGEDEEGNLQAILGYIPYDNGKKKDFSFSLWKAKSQTAFLGVKLMMFLMKEEPHRHMFCNGINMGTTSSIYHRFGFKTGSLKQWYRLQPTSEYKIAKIENCIIPSVTSSDGYSLKKIDSFEELFQEEKLFDTENIPYKSREYVEKRYFNHPSYTYLVYKIINLDGKTDAAIIFRTQECNESVVLRVIDFLGDYSLIYSITEQMDEIAKTVGAEYVDIYETGLEDEKLIASGWLRVGNDGNIIPNYFAPYTQCNVDINFCTTDENIILFKGDGDQDRPN